MNGDLASHRLADLVLEEPSRAEALERFGIDYCCGGGRTLDAACRQQGLDVAKVTGELQAKPADAAHAEGWQALSMSELCDHIQSTHHALLRRELPRLRQLIAKVRERHATAHPELSEVAWTFDLLQSELVPHMYKEERVLFPMIRTLESASSPPRFHCGPIGNPIGVMESEHQAAGMALARLRDLTRGYQPPPDACTTFRVMLDGLARLEADLHQHIHKENNVLFPRVLAHCDRLNTIFTMNAGLR